MIRGAQFIDADFSAVCVAGDVDQQIAEQSIDEPWSDPAGAWFRDLFEGGFKFIEGVASALVNSRSLTGRPDEQAGEQPGEGRVVIPEADEAAEQVRASQEGAVGGRGGSQYEVISSAGACVSAILLKFFSAESALACVFADAFGDLSQLLPVVGRVNVDFDDTWIRCDFENFNPVILWWQVAFDDNGQLQFFGGGFDAGEQVEVIFECSDGGHEDMQLSVTGFDTESGSYDATAGWCCEPLIGGFIGVVDQSESLEDLSLGRFRLTGIAVESILCGAAQFGVTGERRSIGEGVAYGIGGCCCQRERFERQSESDRGVSWDEEESV